MKLYIVYLDAVSNKQRIIVGIYSNFDNALNISLDASKYWNMGLDPEYPEFLATIVQFEVDKKPVYLR